MLKIVRAKSNTDRRDGSVSRIDRLGLIHTDESRKDSGLFAALTDEGFLRCRGRIGRTGNQLYMDSDGNEWIEHRPEGEVFDPVSMESFEMIILTDDHPPVMITAENVALYQKGHLGSTISRDGKYLIADILITDKDLIRSVMDGEKVELSNGYWTTVNEKEGVCPDTGEAYTKVQTKIQGNHCSVVDEARGGPECSLYTDSKVAVSDGGFTMKQKNKDAKLMIGDKEYEVPDEVAAAMAELQAKCAEMEKPAEDAEMEGEEMEESLDQEEAPEKEAAPSMDALMAKIDMLTARVKSNKFDSTYVDARVNLVTSAQKVLGPACKTDGVPDITLMRQVVKAVQPSMAGKVDKAGPEYVRASYDMAIEGHRKSQDSNRELFSAIANADNASKTNATASFDSMQAKLYGRKELN